MRINRRTTNATKMVANISTFQALQKAGLATLSPTTGKKATDRFGRTVLDTAVAGVSATRFTYKKRTFRALFVGGKTFLMEL